MGKGLVFEAIMTIIGNKHGRQIDDFEDLLGNDNSNCLEAIVFLFLDEVVWGGRKKGGGLLKRLITEALMNLKKKYKSDRSMPSCLSICTASNEEHRMPVVVGDRRHVTLEEAYTYAGAESARTPRYFVAVVGRGRRQREELRSQRLAKAERSGFPMKSNFKCL